MATGNDSPKTRQLLLYFSLMSLLVNAVNSGFLLDIPTSYMLKNILHASASQISGFRLVTAASLELHGDLTTLWQIDGVGLAGIGEAGKRTD
jgi:hypothetical protein